jgi:antitoxin ParD1/3/4
MVAKNTSIALSKPYTDFISEKVKSGEFATSSEVVREAMRRYMDKEKQVQALRQALIEGENSGPPTRWDKDSFLKEMLAKQHKTA